MNKDLFFDGKEYISASRASKKLGYSQDYIGELIRKGKVPGKMIGRTWYVELESLLEHKRNKKAKQKKTENRRKNREESRSPIYSPNEISPILLISRTKMKYGRDDAPAFPPIQKAPRDPWTLRRKVIEDTLIGFVSVLIIIASGLHASGYKAPEFTQKTLDRLAQVSDMEDRMFASVGSALDAGKEIAKVPVLHEIGISLGAIRDLIQNTFFYDPEPKVPSRSLVIAPKTNTKPAVQTAEKPGEAPDPSQAARTTYSLSQFDIESLKNDLRAEFKDYVAGYSGAGLSTVNYYFPTKELETFRTVEIARDISHSVRSQGTSDVDSISTIISNILNGGTFKNSDISGAVITDSSFEGANVNITGSLSAENASTTSMRTDSLSFLNATGTSATTTNFFSTNGHFDSLFAGTLSVNDGNFTVGSQLNLVQSDNGLTQFYARRATDLAPSGDFITYYNAAGDTALFRVDNSGNIYSGGITNSGSLTVTSVSTPQFRVQYDSSNEVTTSVSNSGAVVYGVNGSTPRIWWAPQSNRTDTFQFQDASGTPLFSADTLNKRVTIPQLLFTNATGTNATTTNFFSTTASSTNLFASLLIVAGDGLVVDASGKVGIGTSSPLVALSIGGTDALKLPSGTTAERPSLLNTEIGDVRYNTTLHQFEGYGDNSVWQGLGGVIDADQDTKITADTSGADEDALRFFTAGLERLTILSNGNVGVGNTTPEYMFDVLSATTTQARFGYDTSNYFSLSVSGTGTTTLDAIGSGSGFVFSDPISVPGSGTNSQRFGPGTVASNTNDLVIGYQSKSSGARNILIGGNDAGVITTGHDNIQIHPTQSSQAGSAGGSYNVILGGTNNSPDTSSNTIIGYNSIGWSGGTAIGANTSAFGNNGNAIALGKSSVAIRGEFVAGSNYNGAQGGEITDVYFGTGKVSTAPFDYTINGSGGSGTNIAGANLQLAGGKGTGNALGGSILFQTADVGSSGTALQSLTTKMTILADGNVGIGTTSPSFKLDVNGIVNATALYENGAPFIGSQWTTSGNDVYYDDGNVGIGTTDPTGQLHLSGTTTNDSILKQDGTISSNSAALWGTNISPNFSITGDVTNIASLRVNPNALTLNGHTATNAYGVFISGAPTGATNNYALYSNSGTNYFGGNVGIGTTTPIATLDVNGSSVFRNTINLHDGANQKMLFSWSTNGLIRAATGLGLSLQTNGSGSDALTINTSGNVGIGGITNPTEKLEVAGSILIQNNNNLYFKNLAGSGAGGWSINPVVGGNFQIKEESLGITPFVINTSGNVGIGTTTPISSYKLTIAGSQAQYASASNSASSHIIYDELQTGYLGFIKRGSTDVSNLGLPVGSSEIISFQSSLGIYTFGASKYLALGTANSERMRIDTNGNVGIGTSTPSATLDVTGAETNTAYFRTSSTDTTITNLNGGLVNFQNTSGTANNSVGMLFRDSSGTAASAILNQTTSHTSHTGSLNFLTNDGSSIQNRMTVASDGNIYLNDVPDVAHGITAQMPTGSFGKLAPLTTTGGGLNVVGISDAAGTGGIQIAGMIGSTDPTDTVPAVLIETGKKDTTNGQALGSTETVFRINNWGTNVFSILGSGAASISDSLTLAAGKKIQWGDSDYAISANAGSTIMTFRTGGTDRYQMMADRFSPATDNVYNLGHASFRWNTVYATVGVINTSDARQKQDILDSDLGLDFIKSLRPVSYRWRQGDTESVNYGLIAQDVEAALAGKNFGGLDYDPEADIYGLNYSQFIGPTIKAVQELDLRISSTTDAVAGLKLEAGFNLTAISDLQTFASSTLARVDALELRVGEIENTASSGLTLDATTTDAVADSYLAAASVSLKNGVKGLGAVIVQVYDSAIYAASGIFDKVFARSVHTDLICLTDGGGETCMTRSNLDALLISSGGSGTIIQEMPVPNTTNTDTTSTSTAASSTTTITITDDTDVASSTPATNSTSSPQATGTTASSMPATIPTSTESGVGTPTSPSVGADATVASSTPSV